MFSSLKQFLVGVSFELFVAPPQIIDTFDRNILFATAHSSGVFWRQDPTGNGMDCEICHILERESQKSRGLTGYYGYYTPWYHFRSLSRHCRSWSFKPKDSCRAFPPPPKSPSFFQVVAAMSRCRKWLTGLTTTVACVQQWTNTC